MIHDRAHIAEDANEKVIVNSLALSLLARLQGLDLVEDWDEETADQMAYDLYAQFREHNYDAEQIEFMVQGRDKERNRMVTQAWRAIHNPDNE